MASPKSEIEPILTMGLAIEQHVAIWPIESASLNLSLVDLETIAIQDAHSEQTDITSPRIVLYMRGITTFIYIYGRSTFKQFYTKDRRRAVLAAARVFDTVELHETFGIDIYALRARVAEALGIEFDSSEMKQYLQLAAFMANWALCDYDYRRAATLFEESADLLRACYVGHDSEMRLEVALGLTQALFDPVTLFHGKVKKHAASRQRATKRRGLSS